MFSKLPRFFSSLVRNLRQNEITPTSLLILRFRCNFNYFLHFRRFRQFSDNLFILCCRLRRSDRSPDIRPVNALYAFDCCSESLDHDIGFRAIIIITKGQNLNSACCRWHLLLRDTAQFQISFLLDDREFYD